MSVLARGDAERLLRFVGEAENLGGDKPFTGDLLVKLGELVRADWVLYFEHDDVPRRLLEVDRPGDSYEGYGDCSRRLLRRRPVRESPIGQRRLQGDFGALMVSDFLTQRELHQTRFYEVALHRYGIEHRLEVDIPSPPSHWKTFAFDRVEGAFSERDRLVLNLLQPHLGRLWQAARTRRQLAAALTGLDHAEARESRGVILLGARDQAEYASGPARRLLREFAPDAMLVEWLESGCPRPLVQRLGERRLIIERVGDALLLEETCPDVGLTAREREVLTLVARGKTNPEIGRLLWIAPSTVGKHLENIYAKLGVKTRTAAVARFFGPIDVEGDDDAPRPSKHEPSSWN